MVSKYEIRAKKVLVEQGWIVDDKRGMGRWSKNRDFFNLFDLVAVRVGDPIRWIAIKGKAGDYWKLREQIRNFWLPESNQKELWRYTKGIRNEPKKEVIIDE